MPVPTAIVKLSTLFGGFLVPYGMVGNLIAAMTTSAEFRSAAVDTTAADIAAVLLLLLCCCCCRVATVLMVVSLG